MRSSPRRSASRAYCSCARARRNCSRASSGSRGSRSEARLENVVEVSWLITKNFLAMQDAIARGSDALLEKGVLGILVVSLTGAVIWLTLKLLSVQNARLEDAKQNTKDMLAVYQKVDQILDRLEERK